MNGKIWGTRLILRPSPQRFGFLRLFLSKGGLQQDSVRRSHRLVHVFTKPITQPSLGSLSNSSCKQRNVLLLNECWMIQPSCCSRVQLAQPNVQGVVKKRLTFLNSAPTSTVSALRLLSAPSVRFWQQTAIYPVSLWALVVELHPLNWARIS
jgi:hypothetical protein